MNRLPPVALLCTGPVSRSPVARLTNLKRSLRWVKASSYRVASRAVSALHAGVPVETFADMGDVRIWLIYVPREDLSRTLRELRSSGRDLNGSRVLIMDESADSSIADCLRELGAQVATITPVDSGETRYIIEGDPEALRAARELIDFPKGRRAIEIRRGSKSTYIEGALAATKNTLPLIASAVERFQESGITAPEAKSIAEMLVTGAMRSYFRAGRRAIKQ